MVVLSENERSLSGGRNDDMMTYIHFNLWLLYNVCKWYVSVCARVCLSWWQADKCCVKAISWSHCAQYVADCTFSACDKYNWECSLWDGWEPAKGDAASIRANPFWIWHVSHSHISRRGIIGGAAELELRWKVYPPLQYKKQVVLYIKLEDWNPYSNI